MVKRTTSLLVTILTPMLTFAQEDGLDAKIDTFFRPIADWVGSVIFYSISFGEYSVPLVLIILILGALYFTFYFKFANFTLLGTAIKVVKGDYDELDDHGADKIEDGIIPNEYADSDNKDAPETVKNQGVEGEVSHFQALTAALSATVGLGNIAGVAVAVAIGGPGATFWMILAGLLGMATKFVECTLGVKYREVDEDGTVHGGPMYYLSKGLAEKGMGGFGKGLAIFFAVMCVGGSFGGGNMFQANQAAAQLIQRFGIESGSAGLIFGIVMAAIVGVVIIGGIKRIGSVTEKLFLSWLQLMLVQH